jgi:hypothetical protein
MAREGTRSATGNSKPRIFQSIDTAPAIKRTTKPKTKKTAPKKESLVDKIKSVKPAGVTKKKAPAKKESVGAKVGRCSFISSRYPYTALDLSPFPWFGIPGGRKPSPQSYDSRLPTTVVKRVAACACNPWPLSLTRLLPSQREGTTVINTRSS